MHQAGWERLVNWQTFQAADVNTLSPNILNMMLQTKIWTPWIMWELICLEEGCPQLDDPEVKIITLEVEIPWAWSKENPTKVNGRPGILCFQTIEATQARWPVPKRADHKYTFQTFYPWQRRPGEFTEDRCPLHNLCGKRLERKRGVSETEQDLWYHCSSLFPDSPWFELWWITLHESLWSSST